MTTLDRCATCGALIDTHFPIHACRETETPPRDPLAEFLLMMVKNHRGQNPLDRFLMDKDEIRMANQLVKVGLLEKGHAIPRPHGVIFYFDAASARHENPDVWATLCERYPELEDYLSMP